MYVQCIRTALEFFSAGEGSSLHEKKSLSQLTGETINAEMEKERGMEPGYISCMWRYLTYLFVIAKRGCLYVCTIHVQYTS